MRDQFRISVEHDFFYSRVSFLPVVEKSTDFSHNEAFFGLDCVFLSVDIWLPFWPWECFREF